MDAVGHVVGQVVGDASGDHFPPVGHDGVSGGVDELRHDGGHDGPWDGLVCVGFFWVHENGSPCQVAGSAELVAGVGGPGGGRGRDRAGGDAPSLDGLGPDEGGRDGAHGGGQVTEGAAHGVMEGGHAALEGRVAKVVGVLREEGKDGHSIYGAVIRRLAAIVNTPQTDQQCDDEVLPRGPVMEEVTGLRIELDRLSVMLARIDALCAEGGA